MLRNLDNDKYVIIALLGLGMVLLLPASWAAGIPYLSAIVGALSSRLSLEITHQLLAALAAGIVLTVINWPRNTEPLIGILAGLIIGRFVH